MDIQITALEKRVAELEAELKRYKELEWDRGNIKDYMGLRVPITKICPDVHPAGLTDAQKEEIFRQEYLRRVVAF